MKVSIVMAYYNRKSQLFKTLKTIELSKYINETEIIIVDDGSPIDANITEYILLSSFPNLDIKVTTIKIEDRKWVNPCVPFNIGFSKATGDIVILQNPECLHLGDIVEHAVLNVQEDNYITYGCYSINQHTTNIVNSVFSQNKSIDAIKSVITPYNKVGPSGNNGWYNHTIHRPYAFHFTSAISMKNLSRLGGFDERYADGYRWDDNEFVERIRRMGLKILILDENSPISVHQWHSSERLRNNFGLLDKKNKDLFYTVTCRENIIHTESEYFK